VTHVDAIRDVALARRHGEALADKKPEAPP
jgi:hypothetical protein